MKAYLAYKNEIQGFKDVAETVKTMEKIAASSIHFLKQRVANFDSYAYSVNSVLARLSVFYNKSENPLLEKRKYGRKALVVLTGDKGLVDGLWHEIINEYLENKKSYDDVVFVGEKGTNYAKEENITVKKSFSNPAGQVEESKIDEITAYLFGQFRSETFSKVDILYPHFMSLSEQKPAFISFLPFEFKMEGADGKYNPEGLPIFESSQKDVFDWFLQRYIEIFFHKIATETKLSEFSARTIAMEVANDKTNELIKKLTVDFHKERKKNITQKQLESFAASNILR